MEGPIWLICHPRYIESKAQELISALMGENNRLTGTIESVAKAIYTAGLASTKHSRTIALIARSTMRQLQWRDVEAQKGLQEELADIATSNFVNIWMNEYDRTSERASSESSSDMELETVYTPERDSRREDDLKFQASNPRLEEWMYGELYDDEYNEYDDKCSATGGSQPHSQGPLPPREFGSNYDGSESTGSVASSSSTHGEDDMDRILLPSTLMLGDLYAMGLIPMRSMQACILYIAENIFFPYDARLLYYLLLRAGTHSAPRLGKKFLQDCRVQVVLNGSDITTDPDGSYDIACALDVIDELIASETRIPNDLNAACYSQRSCHRWDSTLPCDISWDLLKN